MPNYRKSILGLMLISLMSPLQAYADNPFYFELEFEQQRIPLRDQTRLDTFGFGFHYREPWLAYVDLDMKLGRLGLDHEKDSATQGYNLGGYYAGLGANVHTPEKYRLQAGLDLSYNYYDANDDQSENRLAINWTQAEAKLWLTLRLSTHFKAFACATALSLDGKQRVKGSSPTLTYLKNQDDAGLCGGLIMETEGHGFAAIEANGGNKQGGRIYFGRRF